MTRLLAPVRRLLLVGALAVASSLTSACASAPGRSSGSSSDVLTAQEISNSGVLNAYEAVRKLRANFLSYRGETSLNASTRTLPVVYLDGSLYGELESLRNIPVDQVASIRLFRAYEAQQRFGAGNLGGAIEVTTKR